MTLELAAGVNGLGPFWAKEDGDGIRQDSEESVSVGMNPPGHDLTIRTAGLLFGAYSSANDEEVISYCVLE